MENFWSDDAVVEARTLKYRGSELSREHFVLTEMLRSFSQSLLPIPSYCLDWAMNGSFQILSIPRVPVNVLKSSNFDNIHSAVCYGIHKYYTK
jgi:hypothetical protein